ncbi:MAG: alanine--tRNA ligase [Candidatus Omnitrophica bacterium CG1_02_40_15]|nr:MAG: alanine--tRNA ligase [Candidatus Omnitrophica bacterium CG1_02_40_15]
MKTNEIRERFLRFFEERGHRIYPSDSLVPRNDPSLLFTGAGMNQFKEEFLGRVKGPKRAATCQKCLRTGDLENVGRTAGHHTFFEMLGNFSFGDYFKKDAISWAWEFLTKELDLKEKDLWISVYKDDREAYEIWRGAVKIPEEKILKLAEKDNFWPSNAPAAGPNGPCGPCSEIFFGGPDGAEVWNLVFTQFDRRDGGKLEPLPNKNIDTGMGLERIARVLQGKKTNFEIDSFVPIIDAIKEIADIPLTLTLSPEGRGEGEGQKVNAIADHIRAVVFAISDGVLPSNEERGYVIRKLIRKAFWYGRGISLDKPFLYKVVPVVSHVMKKPYPELVEHRENISQIVMEEEKRFKNTIDEGTERLKVMLVESKSSGILSGEHVFRLYDTYGFPWELTQEIAEGENIKVDIKGFEALMENQRSASKQGSKIAGNIFNVKGNINIKLPDISPFIEDKEEIETHVLQIVSDGNLKNEIEEKEKGSIFLKETNFYGEKGGQAGDRGELLKDGKIIASVINAIDVAGRTQHEIEIKGGILKAGDRVTARVDIERRLNIRKNHTATHLLHNALRKALGLHVKQAGSMVAPERLRFDFTHFKQVTDEELSRIEDIVNENIRKDNVVKIDNLSLEEAKKIDVIALFGEKYGDVVRMVSVGDYSRELCGGTHVTRTGEIGIFKIISESSIASGVRRIEAITSKFAYEKIKQEEGLIKEVAKELNVRPEDITKEIERLTDKLKQAEKTLKIFINKNASNNVDEALGSIKKIKGIDVIIREIKDADPSFLRKNADLVKDRLMNGIFILVSEKDGKIALITGVGKSLQAGKFDAVKILNDIGADFGIKGGGRKDFAQAGSRSGPKIQGILKKAEEIIKGYI